jgi:hypothetical protein
LETSDSWGEKNKKKKKEENKKKVKKEGKAVHALPLHGPTFHGHMGLGRRVTSAQIWNHNESRKKSGKQKNGEESKFSGPSPSKCALVVSHCTGPLSTQSKKSHPWELIDVSLFFFFFKSGHFLAHKYATHARTTGS